MTVHEALLARVSADGTRIGDLVKAVARQTRTPAEEVAASVWDLIMDGRLDYRVDAVVTRID